MASGNGRNYYHYTDKKGRDGIRERGILYESTRESNPNDAKIGDGVYFTRTAPSAGKGAIAENNYGTENRRALKKTEYVVKVRFQPGMKPDNGKKETGRDVHIYPGDVNLRNKDVVKSFSIQKVRSRRDEAR